MPRYTFKQAANEDGHREVTIRFEAETWNEIVESLEAFLSACGYTLPGHLDVEESSK